MVTKIYLGEFARIPTTMQNFIQFCSGFCLCTIAHVPLGAKVDPATFFGGGGRVEVTSTYIQAEKMSRECQQHESKEERQPGINT